jgi:hypothetical protein
MIQTLITPHTDFLILTETRAHPLDLTQHNSTRIRLQHSMKISHDSSHPKARKEVIICLNPDHFMMEGSARESENLGHIAAAVYEIRKSHTMIIGFWPFRKQQPVFGSAWTEWGHLANPQLAWHSYCQEPVAVRAVTLHSPNSNACVKK